MLDPNTDPAAAQPPLPLFRPEVLASQQQKLFGEVLVIRPFSGVFLVWLGLALAAVIMGILLLGRYLGIDKPVSGHHAGLSQDIEAK